VKNSLAAARAKKKYAASAKGKACRKKYLTRYLTSTKGKAARAKAQARYEKTPEGKAIRAAFNAKRRAFSKSIQNDLTNQQWITILEAHNFKCRYCGSSNLKLTIDHVIPVSKGGKHTSNNVVPACQPCNSHKGAKIILDIPV